MPNALFSSSPVCGGGVGWGSALVKAELRQFHEGAGAMRQSQSKRRQTMLLEARHLAEGARTPVRQERGVVAESGGASRRPHQRAVDARLDLFEMIVRPCHAQRGYEMRRAPLGGCRAAFLQQAFHPRHR